MSATIIKSFSGSYEYEPEIQSDTARDGITSFQFSVIGGRDSLNSVFQIDEILNALDQPPGVFRVVRRNLEHIAGNSESGLYRLSVSGEGGTGDSNLYITETSYAMQNQQVNGLIVAEQLTTPVQYPLIYLYPSVTITTNSVQPNAQNAIVRAQEILGGLEITILQDKPQRDDLSGPSISGNLALEKIYITGTSIEKAGGLYRVRATASKGLVL